MACALEIGARPLCFDISAATGSARASSSKVAVRNSSVPGGKLKIRTRNASEPRFFANIQALADEREKVDILGDGAAGGSGFWTRLQRAWQILFPPKQQIVSNAQLAKRRLKMILISDRCSVNDEAKRKIVDNIVGALADFVEIESQEKVELNVSTNSDLGTVYYVTVPVRRVRPEYHEFSKGDFEADVESAADIVKKIVELEEAT